MQLQHIPPDHLLPNPWNTNRVSAEGMEKLARSLQRNGWVKPVIARDLDGTLQILGGQHRVEAALDLGMSTVPVLNLGVMEDGRAKEIGLIDNARYGADDASELAELIADLGGAKEIGEFLPFTDAELAALGTVIEDDDIDDLLDGDEDQDKTKPDPTTKPQKTHQTMRMKVPVEDADMVSELLGEIMSDQGFTESDSLTNAGDALVFMAIKYREAMQ